MVASVAVSFLSAIAAMTGADAAADAAAVLHFFSRVAVVGTQRAVDLFRAAG